MRITTVIFFLLVSFSANSQTLFTYGNKTVSKSEFMNAYWKNKTDLIADKQSLQEYLELYTRYKLKVKAAYDLGLDTLANQRADLETYRRQIEGAYLTDSSAFEQLIDEAYERSLKEIRLSMIVIPFEEGFKAYQFSTGLATGADSIAALDKVKEIQKRLSNGESFESLSQLYSGDTTVKNTKGDIGYITVFTLPYNIENVAYKLKTGEVSAPIIARAGYLLIKKTAERPAMGKLKASQILISVDPEGGAALKAAKKVLADSIYKALKNGSVFDSLATQFSDDKMTFANGGIMPDFGVGRYDAAFESKAFDLARDGEFTAPFETQFGFHIVKRRGIIPVEKNPELAKVAIRGEVMEDARNKEAQRILEEKLLKTTGLREMPYNEKLLWMMTDTFISRDRVIKGKGIKETDVLFSFPKQKISVSDWLKYARARAGKTALGIIDYDKVMAEYKRAIALNYYQANLEDFNPAYGKQLSEFKDGNLLFEVMEKQIWNVASTDEKGLQQYYQKNIKKYVWAPSADAILFTCADKATASSVVQQSKNANGNWRMIVESSGGKVNADSGRFEITQLTTAPASSLQAGQFTAVVESETDNSAGISYIIKIYPQPSQRSFEDAKGMVINDYQLVLEDQWIAQLKKKYPVKINTRVWNELLTESGRKQ
jgi:peptidyl-prolyl cis-trans isomerase SurA